MAKKSKIAKYEKQKALIERYAEERYALKQAGDIDGLRKLPKNSNPNRLKFRDQTDGRPRGYMRKFGLSRIKFRELAHKRGGKVNETRFSNSISSNEEPKYQNKKESVETDSRSQTCKEKIIGITGLTLWVFFSTYSSNRCNVTAIIIQSEGFSKTQFECL